MGRTVRLWGVAVTDPRGQCVGKTRFVSGTEAHRALRKRNKRYRRYAKANVYHCGECGGYHIGHRNDLG